MCPLEAQQLFKRLRVAHLQQNQEPGLVFPVGIVEEDVTFKDGLFTGRVPMTTIRILLSEFSGIDLSQVQEIALIFDQTPSGSLFLGDIELIKP